MFGVFSGLFRVTWTLGYAYNPCQTLSVSCILLVLFDLTWSWGSRVKTSAFHSAAEITVTPVQGSTTTQEPKSSGSLIIQQQSNLSSFFYFWTPELQLYPHEIWNLCFPKQLITPLSLLNSKAVLHNFQENCATVLHHAVRSLHEFLEAKHRTQPILWQINSFHTNLSI